MQQPDELQTNWCRFYQTFRTIGFVAFMPWACPLVVHYFCRAAFKHHGYERYIAIGFSAMYAFITWLVWTAIVLFTLSWFKKRPYKLWGIEVDASKIRRERADS